MFPEVSPSEIWVAIPGFPSSWDERYPLPLYALLTFPQQFLAPEGMVRKNVIFDPASVD